MTREETWRVNYALLKAFIAENGHLPNRRNVENRRLLNCWKYNKRLIKQGRLDEERVRLLVELDRMRTGNHGFCFMTVEDLMNPTENR